MTPKDGYVSMFAGVLLSAAVSFVVGMLLLRLGKAGYDNLEEATAASQQLKKG
jgi:mannitol-specific phosphotransferase system IIBC component